MDKDACRIYKRTGGVDRGSIRHLFGMPMRYQSLDIDTGAIVFGTDPFTDNQNRPWLILNQSRGNGSQYVAMILTTNSRDDSISIRNREIRRGNLPADTYINPWGLLTIPEYDIDRVCAEVTPQTIEQATSQLGRYISADGFKGDRGLIVNAENPFTGDYEEWVVINNNTRPFSNEQYLATQIVPSSSSDTVLVPSIRGGSHVDTSTVMQIQKSHATKTGKARQVGVDKISSAVASR